MGRAERRAYNRKYGKNLSKEEFGALLAIARINAGNFDFSDLDISNTFDHADNTDIVPDGTECKLNYEQLKSMPQKDFSETFKQWIEENKDNVFHVTREDAQNGLICLEEDKRFIHDEATGEQVPAQRWMFDVYTDILIKDETGEYKTVLDIEEQLKQENKENKEKKVEVQNE